MEPARIIAITKNKIPRHLFITQQSCVLKVEINWQQVRLDTHSQLLISEAYHKVHVSAANTHHHLRRKAINRCGVVVVIVAAWLRVVWPVITAGLAINIAIPSTNMMVVMAMMVMTMMAVTVMMVTLAMMASACLS